MTTSTPRNNSSALSSSIARATRTISIWGFARRNARAAESTLRAPICESSCKICRCKFVKSTRSWSQTTIAPAPAAAKYSAAGDPKPPAPTTKKRAPPIFCCPSIPISGSKMWRLYRFSKSSLRSAARFSPFIVSVSARAGNAGKNKSRARATRPPAPARGNGGHGAPPRPYTAHESEKYPGAARGRDKIAQSRSAFSNRRAQHAAQGGDDFVATRRRDFARRARRMNRRPKQRLVGVNVADAGDDFRIHQRGFNRRAPVFDSRAQRRARKAAPKRLRPQIGERLARGERLVAPNDAPEAARIVVDDGAAALEANLEMIVARGRRRKRAPSPRRIGETESSRHPQMSDKRAAARDEQKILRPPRHRQHGFAAQFGFQIGRNRLAQARIADDDFAHNFARDARRERAPHGFDFGQFRRHYRAVAPPRANKARNESNPAMPTSAESTIAARINSASEAANKRCKTGARVSAITIASTAARSESKKPRPRANRSRTSARRRRSAPRRTTQTSRANRGAAASSPRAAIFSRARRRRRRRFFAPPSRRRARTKSKTRRRPIPPPSRRRAATRRARKRAHRIRSRAKSIRSPRL